LAAENFAKLLKVGTSSFFPLSVKDGAVPA
jgi:hypothetical protein